MWIAHFIGLVPMTASFATVLEIVFRVVVVYAIMIVGLRLSGKREIGQMTPFDFVMLLLIANAVQNAMVGPDTSLLGGVVAAATLLVVNCLLTRVIWRNSKIRHLVEGVPTILISNGQAIPVNLEKERISQEVLEEALREHGVAEVSEVNLAVLEIDGSISVIRVDEVPQPPRHRIRKITRKN